MGMKKDDRNREERERERERERELEQEISKTKPQWLERSTNCAPSGVGGKIRRVCNETLRRLNIFDTAIPDPCVGLESVARGSVEFAIRD